MKTIKFKGILLLAMMLTAGRLMAQTEGKQLVIPLSEPGKAYKLDVDMLNAAINVTGYEGKDIIIDVQADGRKQKDKDKDGSGMHRIQTGLSMDITATEKNNVVTVGSDMPGKRTVLTIKVPQNASSMKLNSVNGGGITVNNVNGALEITNVNGAIKLTEISGSVVANTVNGPIVVIFKSIDPKAAMAFTTLNGNVDVTFPASLKANLKMRSDRGEIYTDFDVVTSKSDSKSTRTAKDGMYRITVEDWVTGKVDGGGPEMMLKNSNGNIYIRKAK